MSASSREVNPAVVTERADLRNRMFMLFIEAYDDARRAIQYLRWREGDADDIAPTLYVQRTPRTQLPATEVTTRRRRSPERTGHS